MVKLLQVVEVHQLAHAEHLETKPVFLNLVHILLAFVWCYFHCYFIESAANFPDWSKYRDDRFDSVRSIGLDSGMWLSRNILRSSVNDAFSCKASS